MAVELEVKRRFRLPDALPEQVNVHAERDRARTFILTASLTAYTGALVLGVALARGALSTGPSPHRDTSHAPSSDSWRASGPPAASPAGTAPTDHPAGALSMSPTATPAPTAPTDRAVAGCEDALAQRHQLASSVTSLPRNMTGSAYGALLDGDTALELLRACTPNTWRRADVCVAVEGIEAIGVTVRTTPTDDSVERCMSNAIAGLTFSYQAELQLFRTSVTVTPKR